MTKTKQIIIVVVSILVVCFVLIVVRTLCLEQSYLRRTDSLENKLKDAQQREEKAVVIRHVSKQMEEIAYQQKDVSDEQRKVAEYQATENFRMKQRVEEEWKNAVTAQKEALEAYRLADKQKALAEDRQYQAEHAKRVADTLSYRILGRSLGSLSATQYKTGNNEIASLLAYAAWKFIKKYRGDVFLSSVFNSLSLSSGQSAVWKRHKGGVSAIVYPSVSSERNTFYTVSRYGEILLWEGDDHGGYHTKTLLFEPQYDFRAAYIDLEGCLHVLTYDGKLFKLSSEQPQVLHLEEMKEPINHNLYRKKKAGDSLELALSAEEKILAEKYHRAPATALKYCHSSGQLAIGYEDGILLLFDSERKSYRKLVGHRSAITAIELYKDKLYSCSYDRTLRLWNLSVERPESVVILESTSWLYSLAFDPDEAMLLAGDENGNIYRMYVSPDLMATHIKKNLPRNFTREEWVYYMGNQIPFEVYTSKKNDL